jgi:hypothetical protein
MWIPSKHSRKSVLFPILNLNPGGTLLRSRGLTEVAALADQALEERRVLSES